MDCDTHSHLETQTTESTVSVMSRTQIIVAAAALSLLSAFTAAVTTVGISWLSSNSEANREIVEYLRFTREQHIATQPTPDYDPIADNYRDSKGQTWLSSGNRTDNLRHCYRVVEELYDAMGNDGHADPVEPCMQHERFWQDIAVTATIILRTATAERRFRDSVE